MKDIKIYLKSVFGKTINFISEEQENRTIVIENIEYQFQIFTMSGNVQEFVLVEPKEKFDVRIKALNNVISEIRAELNAIPVLVFDELRLNQRNALVELQIAFVVTGYQIYIPNTIINLVEKDVVKKSYSEYFSVSAQIIYIYMLLNDIRETNARQLDKKFFPLSVPTINRALRELVERGVLETVGNNTRKLYKMKSKKDFWENGKEYLFNPVSKTYYVDYSYSYTLHSNKYALYRIVNPDSRDNNIRYYAITEDQLNKVPQHSFLDEFKLDEYKSYSVVEIFKYNPNWLSKGKYIDPISLYAQFKDTEDIKTRIALRDMLKETIGLDIC